MIRAWVLDRRTPRLAILMFALLIVWFMVSPALVSAIAGFGGYISEKLLGNGTNEVLNLGDSTNRLTVLGTAPVISTLGATSSSVGVVVTTTMTGDLQDLNGMPRAEVWVQWGYSPVMVFSTAHVTVSSTGVQTVSINPDADEDVFYRFVASTDGTAYGAVLSLPAYGSGRGISYWMLNTLLPIVLAALILISVFLLTGNPIIALISAVTGLVGFYIILALVSSF